MQMEVIGVITTSLMDLMITLLGIQLQNGDILPEVMTVEDSYTITLVVICIAILLTTCLSGIRCKIIPIHKDIDTIDGEHKTVLRPTITSYHTIGVL